MQQQSPRYAPIRDVDDWFAGADKVLAFTVYSRRPTQADPVGARQDITGWTFRFDLRTYPPATGSTVLTKTGASFTVTNGAQGLVELAIARADTVAIDPAEYHYTLTRADSGNIDPVAYGEAVLKQSDYH